MPLRPEEEPPAEAAVGAGALGPKGISPDGHHQFRGFEPHERGSANSLDLGALKGGVRLAWLLLLRSGRS